MAFTLSGMSSRFASLFRPSLPPRYSDGWQANTPLDTTKGGEGHGIAAIERGIAITVGTLTSTPKLVYKGKNEAPDSSIAKCIKNTSAAHWEQSFFDMLNTGNGLMRIIKDSNGVPFKLENIQAFRFSAELINGDVIYKIDGSPIDMSNYLHFMARNRFTPFLGDSLLEANHTSLAAVMATLSIYRQLQSNGSHAEMFLTTDLTFSKEQTLRLRDAFKEQTSNQGSSGGVPILTAGLKPMVVRQLPSALDQDIVASLDFTVAEAARITGVPLAWLAVKDATAYASSVENGREYLRNTARPLMNKIEWEMTSKLGQDVRFDIGELALGQGKERSEVLSTLLYAGVISVDEARDAVGYGTTQFGSITSRPANQLPISNWLDNGVQSQQSNPNSAPGAPSPQKTLDLMRARLGI